jgi:hypothetical protein
MSLDVRLTGVKAEIEQALTALRTQGYRWESNSRYYPQRGETSKFAYYLNNFATPATVPPTQPAPAQNSNEPQPGPYDAVLGGKGRSKP